MPERPKSKLNRQRVCAPVLEDHLLPAGEKSVTQIVSLSFECLGVSPEDAGFQLVQDT